MFDAKISVEMKVAVAAMPSSRLACQARGNALGSNRLKTTSMITAASTAMGKCHSNGVRNSRVASTNTAAIKDDRPVRAPLEKFSAEREKDPDTGMPPLNADAILASP